MTEHDELVTCRVVREKLEADLARLQAENGRLTRLNGTALSIFNRMEAEGGHGIQIHNWIRLWREALTREPEKGVK